MKDLDTQCPPSIHREEGELYIKVTFHMGGETYCVRAPIGDGRYHAERVFQLIIAPAIAPRPLDDMP